MIHIIIPVYNAFEALQRCVASVLKHAVTEPAFRVTLINDDSTDTRVGPWLDSLVAPATVPLDVLHNPVNLGFVGTANRGMALSQDDVVLLNADTQVTEGWLRRMVEVAGSDDAIATITPLSNNGEIVSYPLFCTETPLHAVDADAIARAAGKLFDRHPFGTTDLPTGVGFCLWIRRKALDVTGLFDETRFGRGYGEENDLCLRMAQAGYRNVLCPGSYVLHEGSASFQGSAQELKQTHLPRLLELHPHYEAAVRQFIAARPLDALHRALADELKDLGRDAFGRPLRAGVLMVTHNYGGGVERHVRDLQQLLRDERRMEILRPGPDASLELEDENGVRLRMTRADTRHILPARGYKRIHFHHTHGHAADILSLPAQLSLPYDITLHDFAAFCPQYALDTPQGRYCGQPDLAGCTQCVQERPHAWHWNINTWRERWHTFLSGAERRVAPSHHVASQVARYFPDLTVEVHAHPPRQDWLQPGLGHHKVMILGGLSTTKGLDRVLACATLAKQQGLPLFFVILGFTARAVPTTPALPIRVLGEYEDASLPQLAELERADVIWFPGQIPETYSYTLDVAFELGKPVVSSDMGAIAERLIAAGHPRGHLIPNEAPANEWLRALLAAATQGPPLVRHAHPDLVSQRAAYGRLWLSAHAQDDVVGDQPVQPLAWRLPEVSWAPAAGREEAPRSLQSLYEHGVEAGHRVSREALRLRLDDLSQLERNLAAIEARAGRPWYEHIDILQRQTEQLSSDVGQLSTQLGQLAAHHAGVEAELRSDLEQAHRAYGARIQAFETSASWRMTAPLRASKSKLKALFQQLPGPVQRGVRLLRRWPTAVQMWRDHGTWALLTRTRSKLFPSHPPGLPSPAQPLQAIGPLLLDTCGEAQTPTVSIVIPTYGQHLHTFNCLVSLQLFTDLPSVEIILIDDAAPEPLARALPEVVGVRMIRNATNLGFIGSCAAGAELARGDFVLMLNNDVQVTKGWLEALLEVFERRPDAGLVGARLVYPDGRLQEAGGIVWRDGSAWNWGRLADPEHPHFRYLRKADYCSGACLLMRRTDWEAMEGFDRVYAPAYYEDTDLAFRVRARGQSVYYQPEACIIHHEGISSGTDLSQGMKRHQVVNQKTFFERWQNTLQSHRCNGESPRLEADRGAGHRVLIVEACMITPDQDSGSIRMLAMLELLLELGCKVSFVADNLEYRQPYVRQLQQLGVEVWHAPHVSSVAHLLRDEGRNFSHIVFCRHYIAAPYVALARQHAPQARLIFDTVDLHFLREQRQADLEQSASLRRTAETTRQQELGVIRAVDMTLVVSPVELELLSVETPGAQVAVLSNIHESVEHTPGFSDREGLLFVGGFQHPPNVDAVRWFLQEVWPLVHAKRPQTVVRIVGSKMPDSLKSLAGPGIEILGFVQDLDPLLATSKVSIAPLRYGAGVKGKVNQAMAHGLPVVATEVAVEGMYLENGLEVLTGADADAFAQAILTLCEDEMLWQKLATAGKRNIERTFSRAVARTALANMLSVTSKA